MEKESIIAYVSILRERIKNTINEIIRAKKIKGVLSTHGLVLFVLYQNSGRMQMKDLAKFIGRRKSTVTDLIKKLRDLGLVEKIESSEDGRVSYANLTSKAYEFKDIYKEISDEVLEKAFHGMDDEEVSNFLDYLRRMTNNLD